MISKEGAQPHPGADGTAPSRVACQETARVERQNGCQNSKDVKPANNLPVLCQKPHQTAPRRSANNVCGTVRLFTVSHDIMRNNETEQPPMRPEDHGRLRYFMTARMIIVLCGEPDTHDRVLALPMSEQKKEKIIWIFETKSKPISSERA